MEAIGKGQLMMKGIDKEKRVMIGMIDRQERKDLEVEIEVLRVEIREIQEDEVLLINFIDFTLNP